VTKRCVGDPPRQTEDPLSPPCVAHFDGDNFGATYRGVHEDQIVVVMQHSGGYCEGPTSRGPQRDCRPYDEYYDLWEPVEPDDPYLVRTVKPMQDHFNERYQLYGRRLRVWVYFGTVDGPDYTPEISRAEARQNIADLDPFAVISTQAAYREEAAGAGVLVFGGRFGQAEELYLRNPGRIWGYQPSVEQQARLWADFVCTKVVPYPVSFSGNGDNAQPRVLGMLHQPSWEDAELHYRTARDLIEDCGGHIAVDGTYTYSGYVFAGESNAGEAAANIATFQAEGVTTILWAWGWETGHGKAAGRVNYRPEWILGGDTKHEGQQNASLQEQSVWDGHAWVVTHLPFVDTVEGTTCYRAIQEVDPGMPEEDHDSVCRYYGNLFDDLRMISIGAQVAGPRLTPESMERGFRAIPAIRSTDPSVPACFFEPGDYTCIKDGMAMWWDASGAAREGRSSSWPGCWLLAEGGARYFPGTWPEGDVLTMQDHAATRCSGHSGAAPL